MPAPPLFLSFFFASEWASGAFAVIAIGNDSSYLTQHLGKNPESISQLAHSLADLEGCRSGADRRATAVLSFLPSTTYLSTATPVDFAKSNKSQSGALDV